MLKNVVLLRWLLPLLVLTLIVALLVAIPALHTFATSTLQHLVAFSWRG